MIIGVLQFELIIHDSQSLKDKRRVVRSVKDRLHREHQASVAEVAAQDMLNLAVLGLACVGSDGKRVGQVLDRITEKLRVLKNAELGAVSRHILDGQSPDEADDTDDTDEKLGTDGATEVFGLDHESLAQEMMMHAGEISP